MGDPAWVPAIMAPANVRAFAVAAEASGWDAIAFTDHPAPSSRWVEAGGEGVADPFSALGFCAAITDRIRLLTFVLVPAYRNPFVTAQQVATLDALSGGRVTLGLGTGYLFSEFHAVGVDPDRRRELFDDTIDVMQRAWTGEPVEHASDSFSARDAFTQPPVVQRPHPPLWIHGNGRWGTDRAARMGQGWLGMLTGDKDVIVRTTRTTALPDRQSLRWRIDDLHAAAERHGRDPGDIDVVVAGALPMLDHRVGWSADAVRDDMAALEDLGVDWVVTTCCGDDPTAAVESVERFGAEVIAHVG